MSNASSSVAENGTGGLHSVDRALNVLELLARWGDGGVSELAAELEVHKSTAFRLLGALESHGLVEQTEDRGKYRLGFGLVRLAGAFSGRMDITKQARPVAERLANELGETVNLAVLREHYAVNLDQALGSAAVITQNWVGQLTPLHATSSGKVLLAYLPAEERTALLAEAGLKKETPHTLTTPPTRSPPSASSRRSCRRSSTAATPRRSVSSRTASTPPPCRSGTPTARSSRR